MTVKLYDRVHSAAYKAAELLLTVANLRLGAQAAQFSSRPRGKDLKQCLSSRLGRHRPLVEDGQVTQNLVVEVEKRHAHITRRTDSAYIGIVPIDVEEIVGNVNQATLLDDPFAGSSIHHHLPILEPLLAHPECQGLEPSRLRKKLSDPSAVCV